MLPRIVRSPVEICFGTSPSHAPKSRPFENASPVPIAATIALEMIGPMPGTVMSRSQLLSCRASASISLDRPSMRSSSRRQSPARSSTTRNMRGDRASHGDATLQQERADLIDDASALTDQPLTHAVERLRIKLLGGLCRDELHSRALHCLGDCLGVPEVILLSLGIRAHVLRRH